MPAVTFDYQGFITRYPEFTNTPQTQLQAIFDQDAGLYLENNDNSVVSDLNQRRVLLNMLTAHIAMLGGALNGNGGPLPVGRLSSATEGSVSASFSFTARPGSEEWYAQTPYGLLYWQATASFRLPLYVPEPTDFYGNNRQRSLSGPDQFARRFR